jgi:hypothetical protein
MFMLALQSHVIRRAFNAQKVTAAPGTVPQGISDLEDANQFKL